MKRIMVLLTVVLMAALALVYLGCQKDMPVDPSASLLGAKPSGTQTAQGIMVNLTTTGTFSLVENKLYKFNEATGATYFTNDWDKVVPLGVPPNSFHSSNSTATVLAATAPAVEPACTPAAPDAPASPAPDPAKLTNPPVPGGKSIVVMNACNFLDGANLVGSNYTQTLTQSGSCSYISGVKQTKVNGKLVAGSWDVTTTTVTGTFTYVYNYNITPTATAYPPLTAWDLVSINGATVSHLTVTANIAGESVVKSNQFPNGKYSFSLGDNGTDANGNSLSRVQNLVVTVTNTIDGSAVGTYPATSTLQFNYPAGSLDFLYNTNAGSNGVTNLLYNNDYATKILLSDGFKGNDGGGADGKGLALAVMDPLAVDLPEGDYKVTLTGTVKDNSALADLTFSITQTIHVVTPGCGGN